MKKLNEDLVVYTCIEPLSMSNGRYMLTALKYEEGGHCMPGLEINMGESNKKEVWDSEAYLERMLNTLTNWKNRQLNERDLLLIEELKEFIPEDDFEDVQLMLAKGVELGFFNKKQ
jgi:hypothetical protein